MSIANGVPLGKIVIARSTRCVKGAIALMRYLSPLTLHDVELIQKIHRGAGNNGSRTATTQKRRAPPWRGKVQDGAPAQPLRKASASQSNHDTEICSLRSTSMRENLQALHSGITPRCHASNEKSTCDQKDT